MGFLDILGLGNKKKLMIEEALAKGAIVIDVRTSGEFSQGHIEGSINVPLNELKSKMKKIKKMDKVILLCCASGMRSGSATSILQNQGIDCCNAGSWGSLQKYFA